MRTTNRKRLSNPGRYALLLITQESTSAPTALTVINDFGTFTLARTGTGVYTLTKAGAFTSEKTFVNFQQNISGTQKIKVERTSANVITISTFEITYDAGAGVIATATDAILTSTPFEISVYN